MPKTPTHMLRRWIVAALLFALAAGASAADAGFAIATVGNAGDAVASPLGGSALAGGGPDVDEAFVWMADRADGGDFLILRASGGDAYNAYVHELAPQLDSVTTLVVRTRSAASHPTVLESVRQADAIFIAGGDQSVYLENWRGTGLQAALQDRIAAGAVVGGTSAGLAVLPGHVYAARRGTATSHEALHDPFDRQVTLAPAFLRVPFLAGVLTDTHLSERNREGRLVAFLARLYAEGPVRGIGVDEATALLIDDRGRGAVVGEGRVLFVDPARPPQRLRHGVPLRWSGVPAVWADHGDAFDLTTWTGSGVEPVTLTARRGRLRDRAVHETGPA